MVDLLFVAVSCTWVVFDWWFFGVTCGYCLFCVFLVMWVVVLIFDLLVVCIVCRLREVVFCCVSCCFSAC